MDLALAIHKALDFFFCDRCPMEALEGRVSDFYNDLCPFTHIWEYLPEESPTEPRKYRWPRSVLERLNSKPKKLNKGS